MDIKQVKEWAMKNPVITYPCIGLLAFVLVSLVLTPSSQPPKTTNMNISQNKNIGVSVGGVEEKTYSVRLEKNYYELDDRLKSVEKEFKSLGGLVKDLKKDQKDISKALLNIDKKLVVNIDNRLEDFRHEINQNNPALTKSIPQEAQLVIADIQPLQIKGNADSVYLPLGSFCKGTLLTGVYATADQNNPLPVLISLDEAFYGPNKARIPLKGAVVMGKAYGDLVSQRALIQIIAISSVLPTGNTFESEQNLGYVTDSFGELGVRGELIRNTGKQLAATFVSGFMSGGAQGLSDQEVTERRNDEGTAIKEITGNKLKNAIFQGLAQSAGKMSDYYAKQMENLVPAIHIQNGQQVYFIVQKGVTIDGLSPMDLASSRFSD